MYWKVIATIFNRLEFYFDYFAKYVTAFLKKACSFLTCGNFILSWAGSSSMVQPGPVNDFNWDLHVPFPCALEHCH